MKQKTTIALILISFTIQAQVNTGSDLFKELEKQDSTFFERGFNQCDMEYLEIHVAEDLKFYHDQSGFQDRAAFLKILGIISVLIPPKSRSVKWIPAAYRYSHFIIVGPFMVLYNLDISKALRLS